MLPIPGSHHSLIQDIACYLSAEDAAHQSLATRHSKTQLAKRHVLLVDGAFDSTSQPLPSAALLHFLYNVELASQATLFDENENPPVQRSPGIFVKDRTSPLQSASLY